MKSSLDSVVWFWDVLMTEIVSFENVPRISFLFVCSKIIGPQINKSEIGSFFRFKQTHFFNKMNRY